MHTLGKKHISSELTVFESFKNDTLCVFYAAESELLFGFFFQLIHQKQLVNMFSVTINS